MQTLWQDLRYGVRMLLKKPGFTAVAIITLALGIGANTAIFSVVNAMLLRPLPYQEPNRLVMVWGSTVKEPDGQAPVSPPNFVDWRDQNQVFDLMAAYSEWSYNLTGAAEPKRVSGAKITADLFPLLGASPALGRNFLPEEDQPSGNKVAVLSHRLWQRRFGGDASLIGKTLLLDGESYTVVGIMPADFRFPSRETQLWMPLGLDPDPSTRLSLFLSVIARLKPGVILKQAQAEMSAIASRLEQQYPATNTDWGVNLVPLHEQIVGDIRPMLLVLLGAVGFVLLIACANVANLLLARAAARQKEVAIRTALGANRWRVIRQLLTESLILSLLGGFLGLLFALWGVDVLVSLTSDNLPHTQKIGIDMSVLAFTLAVSGLTGLIFGVAPAWQASKPDFNESLKEGAKGATSGPTRQRLRGMLVVSEVALALVLLVGAGLLFKSFVYLQNEKLGFNPENVMVMDVSLPEARYSEPYQRAAFFQKVLSRIETLPGVQSVGATTAAPLAGPGNLLLFEIEGRPPKNPQDYIAAGHRVVSPSYFRNAEFRLRIEGNSKPGGFAGRQKALKDMLGLSAFCLKLSAFRWSEIYNRKGVVTAAAFAATRRRRESFGTRLLRATVSEIR